MGHGSRLLAFAALTVTACHGRPRAPHPTAEQPSSRAEDGLGAIVEIDLSAGAPEDTGASFLEAPHRHGFFRLVSVLAGVRDDPTARGVFVRFGSTQIGLSRAHEIGDLLAKIRETGRKVVCHADGYTNSTFFVAARGCDRIWVSPAGEVALVGIAAQLVFARRLLSDKLGVDVDFLQVGKYKGAEEPFTRDEPSPEARASLESVLAAMRTEWLAGLSGRGESARAAAEDGPFPPETARRKGLIDASGDAEEARKDVRKLAEVESIEVRFGTPGGSSPTTPNVGDWIHALAGGSTNWGGPAHVSVVRASGEISMGGGRGLLGDRSGIAERTLSRIVHKLTEDASCRAVVLRIDSPGGSALASDLLWKRLMRLRAAKPLIVSIGDMAASGGYYLASAGTRILAEPTSIVGSIGVVGGKLAFGKTLEQVGVHIETVAAAPGPEARARAGYESPLIGWDPPTRVRVLEEMTAIYELFVRRVAEGRDVPIAHVMDSAEGRIFAGEAAKTAHLVDEWGGLSRAITVAKDLGHLEEDAPVRLIGKPSGLWDLIDPSDGDDGSSDGGADSGVGTLLRYLYLDAESSHRGPSASLVRSATELAALLPEVRADHDLAVFGTHLASLRPLVAGEHAIAAIPFALLLH